MNIILVEKPSIAAETAVMLYRHAQKIKYEQMKKKYYLKAAQEVDSKTLSEISKAFDKMADIEKRVCKSISAEDEQYKFFFEDNGTDAHGPEALLGRSVATTVVLSLMDPCITDFYEQRKHIKLMWDNLKKSGYTFNVNTMRFEIRRNDDVTMGENYLLEQIEKLTYSDAFKFKIYKTFAKFDETVDEIFAYMHPYAQILERELDTLDEIRQKAMQHWKNALDDRSNYGLAQCCLAAMEIDDEKKRNADIKVNVLMCETNVLSVGGNVEPESDRRTINFTCGFDIRNEVKFTKANADPSFYFGIMKVLSDSSKLKMLRKMSKKTYSCSTLAAELGLDAGNTSRNLKTLNELGFLVCEKQGGRMSYKTDRDAVRYILGNVQKFILDEGITR